MSAHLVVVDLQVVFEADAPGWPVPRFGATLDPVARLVEAFGDAVTFTRFIAPASPRGAWRDYYAEFPWALEDAAQYDLTARFARWQAASLALPAFGKWGPELAARAGGADELVVCGVSTDCCVLSTVLPAADAGLRVRLAADACAGATDADHERALDAMRLYAPLVDVTTAAAVLERRPTGQQSTS